MNPIAKIYAMTGVTLRGDLMLIPAWHFEENIYPFDLQIILPNLIFTSKKNIFVFLKFLNLVHFHYKGRLIISSMIIIETDPILDQLNNTYFRLWKQYSDIKEVPTRRQLVEQAIVKWSFNLPKNPIGEFINQYYSVTLNETNWHDKNKLWKTLSKRALTERKIPGKLLEKIQDRYLKTWFKYFEKIEFSPQINSKYPNFIKSMDQLTFKELSPIKPQKICPACETDLSSYLEEIKYCPKCGYALFELVRKFCANCGEKLRVGSSFCSQCGMQIN